jgi:glyoxylase I family protein
MERVTGIGGVFFRARDPIALKQWYDEHLGVTTTPDNYQDRPWWQQDGPTVFEPFPHDTTYFDNPRQMWMINFRVRNLDAMVEQLRARRLDVTVDPKTYPNGRFARLRDPEGNPIELWEPQGRHAPDLDLDSR